MASSGLNKNQTERKNILPKYKVEYALKVHDRVIPHHHETEDPVSCHQFLAELLRHGFMIKDIKHDGVSLSKTDFNQLVKFGANILASDQICASLAIKPEEEKYRFGFAA